MGVPQRWMVYKGKSQTKMDVFGVTHGFPKGRDVPLKTLGDPPELRLFVDQLLEADMPQ